MRIQAFIGAAALAVCVTGTARPSGEELEALLNNPTSDWSILFSDLDKPFYVPKGLDTDEYIKFRNSIMDESATMRTLADLDRKAYVKLHPTPLDGDTAMDVGLAHAICHNLIRTGALRYAYAFRGSIKITKVFNEEQASLIARIRNNPTEDFDWKAYRNSEAYDYFLMPLAEADARIYLEDHKVISRDLIGPIGSVQASKHHLTGAGSAVYAGFFIKALDELLEDAQG